MINYNEIFNTIVETSKKSNNNASKEYLKFDIIGNTIVGRFVPNIKNPASSIYGYYHHGWKSKLDGTGMFFLCPNTYGEKCPICAKSSEMWKSNDPVIKELSKTTRRRSNWLANFYIISNPKNVEDEGKIKLFRFGKQIRDKYTLATEGDDAQFYGSRIFRLDDQGCSFRIKCEQNSTSKEAWPTYTNSSFLPATAIPDMTDEKIELIHNSVIDLTKLFKTSTRAELVDALNKHYLGNEISEIPEIKKTQEKEVSKQETIVESKVLETKKEVTDSTIDDMLKELGA